MIPLGPLVFSVGVRMDFKYALEPTESIPAAVKSSRETLHT